jgi:hypothetical protein
VQLCTRTSATFLAKARAWSEEARRRLSGHGFSPQERRAKDESELIFLAGENQRADDPKPEPFLDNFPVKTYSRLIKEKRRWKFK